MGTISFDSTCNIDKADVDGNRRDFTSIEMDIYSIRKTALRVINSDTLFKTYKNTNLNVIPIVETGQKKVYVITGPQITGVVVFGNDYLLTFDKDNKLITKKQLHKNIMPINYGNEEGKEIVGTMHSHLPETGDFITATDVCTLMLYEKLAKWEQHIVISEKYVSIWNCEKNEIVAITKQAWGKTYTKTRKENERKIDGICFKRWVSLTFASYAVPAITIPLFPVNCLKSFIICWTLLSNHGKLLLRLVWK